MIDNSSDYSTIPQPDIRIVGLNVGKTRRALGSYDMFKVYFDLSEHPPLTWKNIFGREWKDLNVIPRAACIDGRSLVVFCRLLDVATTHLPHLKGAVRATNIA